MDLTGFVTPSSILRTSPKSGDRLTEEVTLVVSNPGSAVTLSELGYVDRDGCSTAREDSVGGTQVSSSVACNPRSGGATSITYVLARHAVHFEATIGLSDRQGTRPASISIAVDGKVIERHDLSYGKSFKVGIDVSDAMRLTLRATTSAEEDLPVVVFGDPTLLGLESNLDQLRAMR
jgi:hypothetical protein